MNVLVCDDSGFARKQLMRALPADWPVTLHQAADGLEGVDQILMGHGDLIFLDLTMPEMDGLEFLEAVRKDDVIGKTVFIMLTGSADKEVVQKAAALGVNNYVVKPFAPAALKEKIERVFGELV